jgi:hypothetical protein
MLASRRCRGRLASKRRAVHNVSVQKESCTI